MANVTIEHNRNRTRTIVTVVTRGLQQYNQPADLPPAWLEGLYASLEQRGFTVKIKDNRITQN